MSLPRTSWVLALGVIALSWGPVRAAADLGHPAVERARQALSRYDLDGNASTRVIAALGRAIDELDQGADRREARFIRAMAAGDLVLIAHRLGDDDLRRRVAAAMDVPRERLLQQLVEELRELSVGVYGEAASDAADGLEAMDALDAGRSVDWTGISGARSDALFVTEIRRALERDDPVAVLSSMAVDPCRSDATDAEREEACSEALERFDGQGRRAVAALKEGGGAIVRLRAAGRTGDPFPRALDSRLSNDAQALQGAVLTPTPRLPEDASAVVAPAEGEPATAHLVLVIHPGQLRYGWTPQVRLGEDGEIQLGAPGRPMLPEMKAIAIPRDFRPAVTPVKGLADELRELGANEGATVAISASEDLMAHVVARVLHSARATGLKPSMLVGRAADGTARGVPIRVRDAREGPEGKPAARVFVRMGGYTVKTRKGSTDVPRIRDDSGLHFDVDGLVRAAGGSAPASASLDFMTVAKMGPILKAAFHIAPETGELQLLVP